MKLNELNLPVIKDGKAGLIPYFIEDGVVQMLFMKSSNAAFGDSAPMIAKGHVDPGESFEAAGVREAEEELGIRKSNLKEVYLGWSGELSGELDHYEFKVYTAEVHNKKDFDTPCYETESVHWLTIKEFEKVGRKSHLKIVQSVHSKIIA